MTYEIGDLLSALRIVDSDDARIASSRKITICGTEFNGTHWFDQSGQRMSQPAGGVVEDKDAAVLVAGSCHLAVCRDVNAHSKRTFGLVCDEFVALAAAKRGGVVDMDSAIDGRAGQILSVLVQGWCPMFASLLFVCTREMPESAICLIVEESGTLSRDESHLQKCPLEPSIRRHRCTPKL